MLALAFFSWWYGRGWQLTINRMPLMVSRNVQTFSVSILLKTLFEPWKRIVSNPGVGISAHAQASLDNAISRIVGFFVRILVLIAALVTTLIISIIGIVQIIIWPLLPPLFLLTIILGFIK